jgi:hypothetical protein
LQAVPFGSEFNELVTSNDRHFSIDPVRAGTYFQCDLQCDAQDRDALFEWIAQVSMWRRRYCECPVARQRVVTDALLKHLGSDAICKSVDVQRSLERYMQSTAHLRLSDSALHMLFALDAAWNAASQCDKQHDAFRYYVASDKTDFEGVYSLVDVYDHVRFGSLGRGQVGEQITLETIKRNLRKVRRTWIELQCKNLDDRKDFFARRKLQQRWRDVYGAFVDAWNSFTVETHVTLPRSIADEIVEDDGVETDMGEDWLLKQL